MKFQFIFLEIAKNVPGYSGVKQGYVFGRVYTVTYDFYFMKYEDLFALMILK